MIVPCLFVVHLNPFGNGSRENGRSAPTKVTLSAWTKPDRVSCGNSSHCFLCSLILSSLREKQGSSGIPSHQGKGLERLSYMCKPFASCWLLTPSAVLSVTLLPDQMAPKDEHLKKKKSRGTVSQTDCT